MIQTCLIGGSAPALAGRTSTSAAAIARASRRTGGWLSRLGAPVQQACERFVKRPSRREFVRLRANKLHRTISGPRRDRRSDLVPLQQRLPDDHPLDLGSALADQQQRRVAVQPLDLVLLRVAVAAVDAE